MMTKESKKSKIIGVAGPVLGDDGEVNFGPRRTFAVSSHDIWLSEAEEFADVEDHVGSVSPPPGLVRRLCMRIKAAEAEIERRRAELSACANERQGTCRGYKRKVDA